MFGKGVAGMIELHLVLHLRLYLTRYARKQAMVTVIR